MREISAPSKPFAIHSACIKRRLRIFLGGGGLREKGGAGRFYECKYPHNASFRSRRRYFPWADLAIDGAFAGTQNDCENLSLPCIAQNAESPPARMRAIATSAARPLNPELLPPGRGGRRRVFPAARRDVRSLGEAAGLGRILRHPGKSPATCSFPPWRLCCFSRREFLPSTTLQNACRAGLAGTLTARAECPRRRFLSAWRLPCLRSPFTRRMEHF